VKTKARKAATPKFACILIARLFVCLVLLRTAVRTSFAAVGDTEIAKWQGNKKAVFLLMFDDSWPSQWQVAVPELEKRGLVATFYICPGKAEFLKFKDKWANDVPKAGMVLGNHTMTHKGVTDVANAEAEIGGATKAILEMVSGKNPRLISFAMPGVGPGQWNISSTQYKELLEKHHLIDRPPFAGHGAVYHLQKLEQMLKLADRAIAAGEMEYLVVHGVERHGINWGYQDMWPLSYEILTGLLDGLRDRQNAGDLWVTDHISWYRYQAEREHASVKVLSVKADEISLELACSLDHDLYDLPLTVTTSVPAEWKTVSIVEKDQPAKTIKVNNQRVVFDAVPNNGKIKVAKQG